MGFPLLVAGLWLTACQSVPAAPAPPRPEANSTPLSSGEASPGDARGGGSPFLQIADGPCEDAISVIDAEDATFLVSRTQARRAQPGRPELEDVAGLPSPRWLTQGFALHPFIVEVHRPEGGPPKPDTLAVLGYFLLDPRTLAFSRMETARFGDRAAFGDYPMTLPVRDGVVIVTFTEGTKRPNDSGYGVPAGDGSEAMMVSRDGRVSPLSSWPNVLFNMPLFAVDDVIWAMAIRPGMPGNFVLRVPVNGSARFFPVPSTQGCRRDDRLYPAKLLEEGANSDEVTVEVQGHGCVPKGAVGSYRFRASDTRWRKQPEGPGTSANPSQKTPVQIGGATLRIEGTTALITGPGMASERDADPDPAGGPGERSLVVTAGGREVWLETRWPTHCRLGRYRSW